MQCDPDNGFYYCMECWKKVVMSILSQEHNKKHEALELERRAGKAEQGRRPRALRSTNSHKSGTGNDEDSHESTDASGDHSELSASVEPTGFRNFIDLVKGVFKPHVAAQDTCQCSHQIVSEDCLDPDDSNNDSSDACSEWSSDEDSYSSDEDS
jgi:hypothetical protein